MVEHVDDGEAVEMHGVPDRGGARVRFAALVRDHAGDRRDPGERRHRADCLDCSRPHRFHLLWLVYPADATSRDTRTQWSGLAPSGTGTPRGYMRRRAAIRRLARRRLFVVGLAISTLGSAAAALASSAGELIAARAIQGIGGAIVLPLTLTILSAAVPAKRRGLALGAWGGIGGLAVALGPLVGGAIVQGISWQWIFWLNVPFGLILIPLALTRLQETRGANDRLDPPGLALSAAGLFAIVWGLVRGNESGWA